MDVFISLSLQKCSFAYFRIWNWQVFFFHHLKMLLTLSCGLYGFWWESTVVWIGLYSYRQSSIYLLQLSRFFFFVSILQKFDYDISWWECLWLYPVGSSHLFESTSLCLLPNWGKFWPLFLWILFSTTLFLLSSRDLNDINVSSFVTIYKSLKFYSFGFSPFSLYSSYWIISIVLSSSSTIPFSGSSILLLSPSTEFLNFSYWIFQFWNFCLVLSL